MKVARLLIVSVIALVGTGLMLWVRERRTHSVYSAREAASLLHPARRLIYPPRDTVAALRITAGQRVLELGCGPGYFTTEAASGAAAAGQVVCVDLQPGMIDELRRRLIGPAASSVRPLVADAMHLPFADASFDRAFLVAVLGEVPDQGRALVELRRVLRPGGTVSFCETLTDPDYIREGTLRRACADAGLGVVARRRQLLGYIMTCSRA